MKMFVYLQKIHINCQFLICSLRSLYLSALVKPVTSMSCVSLSFVVAIEGFGGKRALGFLLKSELSQKPSKFRMQFCLGALNNVLSVFLLKFASFSRYYVCKKACICGLVST